MADAEETQEILIQSRKQPEIPYQHPDRSRNQVISMGIPPERYCDSHRHSAGAWLRERGVDLFFECTGRNEALSWGIDSMRPMGRVVLVGNPFSDMTLEKDIYWKILRNQLTVTGTWNSSFTGKAEDDWHYVLDRLEQGAVRPAELITHRLPLAGLLDGLIIMKEKKEDCCKIVVCPEAHSGYRAAE